MSPEISFGVMADCQFDSRAEDFEGTIRGSDKRFRNCYSLSPGKLEEAVEEFNRHDLEFTVHLGDFIDRNLSDADRLHGITERMRAPLWHVLGNHEFWHKDTEVQAVLDKYNMEYKYYSRRKTGSRFIVLDTCDLGVLEHKEGSLEWRVGRLLLNKMRLEGAIQAYHWNGGLGDQQLEWLDGELTDAANADEKAILFAHHPVFPPSALNALNRNEILNMIDSYDNVAAFINGHDHGGDFGIRGGVPYITMPGMLSGDSNAYGVAHLYKDRLEIEGYGRVEDRILTIGEG